MNNEQAAERFVELIVSDGVVESLAEIEELMSQPQGVNKQKWEGTGRWFADRSAEEQETIRFLMKEAISAALHSALVQLDGDGGYLFFDEHPAELQLSLRVYEDLSSASVRGEHSLIPIAPAKSGERLHDRFKGLMEEKGLL